MRKVIIGFEPGADDRDALRLGRLLSEVLAAEPVVVSALGWPSYMDPSREMREATDTETAADAEAIADQLSGLEFERRMVPTGSPARVLQDLAEAEQAVLIALGSSRKGVLGRTLNGSIGISLMHGAPCAVAVAPQGYADREQHRLLKIAVGFDGHPESWAALETAIGLAGRCHGYLTVYAVADFPRYGYAAAYEVLSAEEVEAADAAEKHRLLELALSRAPAGLSCEGQLLTGYPGEQLRAVSEDHDLLITGSRSYGPLRRTLLGSTSRKLILSSACPVLVVPRGAGVDPLGLRDRTTAATRAGSILAE